MKNNLLIAIILLLLISTFIHAQDNTQEEITQIKEELESIKKDVEDLKQKTQWFSFNISGNLKMTYGVALKAYYEDDDGLKVVGNNILNHDPRITFDFSGGSHNPISHGFDFENNLFLNMNFGNKYSPTSSSIGDYGTEIFIALQIKSMGISEMQPEGNWYSVNALDEQGNVTQIYFPRYERGGSNVVFGNFQLSVKEASVRNIIGSGFFVSYKDVQQVDQYYGVEGIADILSLNNEYFNNGYMKDSSTDGYQSLYYSYDDGDFAPESRTAAAIGLWANHMLYEDPVNSDYNQKPHGMSFGFNKKITSGVTMFIEAGIASKDAFDPKYFDDEQIDMGFFLKAEPQFNAKKFSFHPKLAFSYAFQTESQNEDTVSYGTFTAAVSLPFSINIIGKQFEHQLNFALNWNVNLQPVYMTKYSTASEPLYDNRFAQFLSFNTQLNLFDNKFSVGLPFIFSSKNSRPEGFLRIGHEDEQWIDQMYEDIIIHTALVLGFDSQNLFGNLFQYRVTNSTYFAYIQPWIGDNEYSLLYGNPGSEQYFYNILLNEFIFNDFGPQFLNLFLEVGLGYQNNARMVDSTMTFEYVYDRNADTWTDSDPNSPMLWPYRWESSAVVMSFKTGFAMDIIKNFGLGLSVESPKLRLGKTDNAIKIENPIGNQYYFALFQLWTEIRF